MVALTDLSNLPKLSGAVAEKNVTPMIESAATVTEIQPVTLKQRLGE